MQTKDIPDAPVLEFLSTQTGPCTRFGDAERPGDYPNSVVHAMPPNIPDKLVLSKMRRLIKRGLVEGCGCGCRGDFILTEKGGYTVAQEQL